MLFTLEKERFLRKLILAAFILAMLGPWSFDLLGVPAQFPCNGPAVRLMGDYCGYPFSGFRGIIMVFTSLSHILGALMNGYIAMLIPELISLVIMLFAFLPVVSFPLIWKKSSRRSQIMSLIVWGLGSLAASAMFAMQAMRPQVAPFPYLVWGVWLYILVAIGAVILDVFVLRANARKSRDL